MFNFLFSYGGSNTGLTVNLTIKDQVGNTLSTDTAYNVTGNIYEHTGNLDDAYLNTTVYTYWDEGNVNESIVEPVVLNNTNGILETLSYISGIDYSADFAQTNTYITGFNTDFEEVNTLLGNLQEGVDSTNSALNNLDLSELSGIAQNFNEVDADLVVIAAQLSNISGNFTGTKCTNPYITSECTITCW